MKPLKIFLYMIGMLLSTVVSSMTYAANNTGNYSQVSHWEVTAGTGRLAFFISGFSDSTVPCTFKDQFAIYPADPAYKSMVATLMAAKVAGLGVLITYSGCSADGYYIAPTYVTMQ